MRKKFDKPSLNTTIARLFFIFCEKIGISYRGRRRRSAPRDTRQAHRINQHIRVPEVRVVDTEGEMLGVMSTEDARARAKELEVDLVEISPNAKPPVCKLIDYGKFLYEEKKKQQENKKSEKTHEIKGVRLTFKIDVGDLDRQRKLAEKFLTEGNTVRIQMRLRGRERAHTPLAVEKLMTFLESLSDVSSIEQPARPNGFQIIAILKPSKK